MTALVPFRQSTSQCELHIENAMLAAAPKQEDE